MAEFEDIKKHLQQLRVDVKVIDLPATAVSVDDVIRLSNGTLKREEIIKTLIVKLKDGSFVACILKGEDRLNMNVQKSDDHQQIVGFERMATKEEVLNVAEVEVGAVCPVLLGISVVIDKKVMDLTRVNMGSGDHLKGLEMDLCDLLKVLSDYKIEEISI